MASFCAAAGTAFGGAPSDPAMSVTIINIDDRPARRRGQRPVHLFHRNATIVSPYSLETGVGLVQARSAGRGPLWRFFVHECNRAICGKRQRSGKLARSDIVGGQAYDALHLQFAEKCAAERIYTFNVPHFVGLAPHLEAKIAAP
jgi:hypothetical protein